MASFEPVRAILRGLEVLRVVSEHGPIGATDVAKRVGLPQPTTVRILETLVEAGYVYRNPAASTFGVTARTKTFSRGYDATSRLVQLVQPMIEDLRKQIGWPSNLAVFEGDGMVIAYTNRSAYGLSIPGRLGAQIPLLATGVGRVYLANVPLDERRSILERLRLSKRQWDAESFLWDDIDARLDEIKALGYAFADESYLDEVYQSRIWAVAVPIQGESRPVAAISSLVLRDTGTRKKQLSTILPALKATAALISSILAQEAAG